MRENHEDIGKLFGPVHIDHDFGVITARVALVEEGQREDLQPLEEARAFSALLASETAEPLQMPTGVSATVRSPCPWTAT